MPPPPSPLRCAAVNNVQIWLSSAPALATSSPLWGQKYKINIYWLQPSDYIPIRRGVCVCTHARAETTYSLLCLANHKTPPLTHTDLNHTNSQTNTHVLTDNHKPDRCEMEVRKGGNNYSSRHTSSF